MQLRVYPLLFMVSAGLSAESRDQEATSWSRKLKNCNERDRRLFVWNPSSLQMRSKVIRFGLIF